MAQNSGRTRIIIFHAEKEPNSKGELNWFEESTISNDEDEVLDELQEIIGGSIELAPHLKGYDAPFVAYIDDEGLSKEKRRNDLAGGTLTYLGFNTRILPLGCAYAGTVVLLGHDDQSLTDEQIIMVKNAMAKYKKSLR